MTEFSLKRTRSDAATKEEVIDELIRIARELSGNSFSTRDFNRISTRYSHTVVFRFFETWELALAAVGVKYKRKFTSRRRTTDVELFEEMERVWKALGHRPSRQEWTQQRPAYSYKVYSERFGGWLAACGNFIEYKSGQWTGTAAESDTGPTLTSAPTKENSKIISSRTIPLKVRFRVMDRDGYKCVLCGKSPATDLGTKLHLDHCRA